ncbi:MAG: type III-B CRISPR module-associated protein Cmr5 [Kiritimatiellaeota bacterium]|nr:type III-B CRISPR module-associated protein Cmr5 [Kiritimatiellota bacterium]
MKNLEQIRAKNALAAKIGTGKEGGESVAKKVPTMIIENGFLGAYAFAIENGKGYLDVFNAVITHLTEIGLVPPGKGTVGHFCEMDANALRAVTAEAMAYLNYLRRLAKAN